ncbi:hypothetical protein JCM8097_000303 [Rhodosporidiobolus ruineniae]
MAVLASVVELLRARESLASVRSPVLLPPVDTPPSLGNDAPITSAPSSPPPLFPLSRSKRDPAPLTEHALRATHLQWLVRFRDLSTRLTALLSAKADGLDSCWAGKTTASHLRAVQTAADEARWVEEKLREAIVWCRREAVKKLPVKVLVGASRKNAPLRPAHSRFPPSLLELPYPLPRALESNLYTLVVPRPPAVGSRRYHHRPQERDEEREAQARDAPPVYSEQADEAAGEVSVERSVMEAEGGEEAYVRALADLLRDVHSPAR